MNDLTPDTKRTTATQARGMERRERLMAAATTLLGQFPIEDITLALVAKRAGIPIGSTYHFYPKINELFAAMASRWHAELQDLLSRPYTGDAAVTWQSIVETSIKRATAFYNERPDGRQLILSDKSSPDIKHADRSYDQAIGQLMIDLIRQSFELPDFPGRTDVFFYSVEIADLFFMLSNIRHGTITEEFCTEAQRAVVSYLRNYLPLHLPVSATEKHHHPTP
nr:TetR/AcrR family transcriptional regulator [uncultured Pseudomonas sp.]